jgi:hypothetical protein
MLLEEANGNFTSRARSGTIADLRGNLADKIKKRPTSEEIDQWIDEARSRALPQSTKKRRS